MQIINAIANVFNQPPIKFEPQRHSLKAWAMYCLRDRGFKVVHAEKADFAVETRTGEKVYFKVTDTTDNLDKACGWIVWDNITNSATVISPQS